MGLIGHWYYSIPLLSFLDANIPSIGGTVPYSISFDRSRNIGRMWENWGCYRSVFNWTVRQQGRNQQMAQSCYGNIRSVYGLRSIHNSPYPGNEATHSRANQFEVSRRRRNNFFRIELGGFRGWRRQRNWQGLNNISRFVALRLRRKFLSSLES